MNQNSSFLYVINHEAIQLQVDAKKPFEKYLWIIHAIMKPILEVWNFIYQKIFQVLCLLYHIVLAPAPAQFAENYHLIINGI